MDPELRTGEDNKPVQLSHAESGLRSQLHTPELRPGASEVPEGTWSEGLRIIQRTETGAASVPGSEYWLP